MRCRTLFLPSGHRKHLQSDPKPPARIKDPELLRALHEEFRNQPCEALCGHKGQELSHTKSRGARGDDVRDNLRWLCRRCHRALHGNPWVDIQGIRWDADRVRHNLGT